MSAPSRNRAAVWAGLLLLAFALAAEEKPARVPWAQIEAWATQNAPPPPATTTPTTPTTPETKPDATATQPEERQPEKPDVPVARTGDHSRPPKAWLERYAQISTAMRHRLRATGPTQHKQLFDVNYLMEQYDKAIFHLTSMLKDTRNWPDEEATGWIAGRLWETALLQGGTINNDVLTKYYGDWQAGERARLQVQAGVLATSTLTRQKKYFTDHQAYFQECKNIAEVIKQKERDGASDPNALWEMCERFYAGHPDVPVVYLRYLYKLREWYPDFPQVRDGTVQMRIAFALAIERLGMHKAAAEEMERLIEQWPKANYPTTGYADYYASLYWMNYGDQLSERRERKLAREAWQKALDHAQRLKKDFPKNALNQVDPDSGHSDTARLLRRIMDEDRLGSSVAK